MGSQQLAAVNPSYSPVSSASSEASLQEGEWMDRLEAGQPLPAQYCRGVIALGNFDGFHPGHQAVVCHAVALARARGVAAIVATFDPHPVRYFRPQAAPFLLTTLDQRERHARESGADALLVFRFDRQLASVTPENFVERWLPQAGAVVTGSEFAYGHNRLGDVPSLARSSASCGVDAFAVPPILSEGEAVSSSRIRQALRQGDCATATRLLTRPYKIEGELRLPDGFAPAASMIGASLDLGEYLCPGTGTYTVRVRRWDGRFHDGFARICDFDLDGLPPLRLELSLDRSARWRQGEPVQVSFLAKMQAPLANRR